MVSIAMETILDHIETPRSKASSCSCENFVPNPKKLLGFQAMQKKLD